MSRRRLVVIIIVAAGAWCILVLMGATALLIKLRGSPVAGEFTQLLTGHGKKLYQGKPIPAGPDAYTEAKLQQVVLRYEQKWNPIAYQKYGSHNPAWDADAMRFLELCAPHFANAPDAPTPKALLEAAQPLIKSGCDDAGVIDSIGRCFGETGDFRTADAWERRALEAYEKSSYPPGTSAWTAAALADYCTHLGAADARPQAMSWLQMAVSQIPRAADKSYFEPYEQRIVWKGIESILHQGPPTLGQQLLAGLEADPQADPWVTAMVGGTYHIAAGWQARGGGWANSVTPQGWKELAEHLKKARQCFERAWKLHPEYPEAATAMMSVVQGGGGGLGDTERVWFDRAVAAQFEYDLAYQSMELCLRPRWGGSTEALEKFALECLNTRRFDTLVPGYYRDIMFMIANDESTPSVWQRKDVYLNLKTLHEGVLAEPSRQRDAAKVGTLYASDAWRFGEYQDARRELDELGDKFIGQVFHNQYHLSKGPAIGEVYARTGPAGETVSRAEEAYQQEKLSEATSLFEAAAKADPNPKAQRFFRHRLQSLRWEKDFADGKEVHLTAATADFDGWDIRAGGWLPTTDGALISVPDREIGAILIANLRLHGSYEMRCEVEFPPGTAAIKGAQGGLVLGFAKGAPPCWESARVVHSPDVVLVGHCFGAGKQVSCAFKQVNEIRAVSTGSGITISMNGQEIVRDYRPDSEAPPDDRPLLPGVGGYRYAPDNQPVRYRDIRIVARKG